MLITDPDGIYVDGTLGGAGHAGSILERLSQQGRVIGFDQDEDAISAAKERLAPYGDRAFVIRSNYSEMKEQLLKLGISAVDGILLDLGVSSYQLDEPSRGFSYMEAEAPLDMRMDRRSPVTAADILATYSEPELFLVIHRYGEDKFAKQIARKIVQAREKEPIRTAGQLNELIREAIPARLQTGGHPSKRTFQALRIEVNRELAVLEDSIDGMIDLLKPGGRLCVITFHSLEDRIVKQHMKTNESPCTCPPDFPVCVCGKVSKGRVITKKAVLPGEEEIAANPRAKSAKLRVFEKEQ